MPRFFACSMGLMILLACCGEPSHENTVIDKPPFPAIEESKLLVIHHDQEGSLIHYLELEKVSAEMVITIIPKKDNGDVYVTVLGTKRHTLLKRDFTVFSKAGEGSPGQVDVFVENGMAVSINGKGIESPGLVSNETLKLIDEQLLAGHRTSAGTSTIRIEKEGVE